MFFNTGEWEYRDVVEVNGKLEERVLKKSYKKDKFRAEVRLMEYEGKKMSSTVAMVTVLINIKWYIHSYIDKELYQDI